MRNYLFIILLSLIELIAGITSINADESKSLWTEVQPLKKRFRFVDHRDAGAQLKLVGTDGTPLYLIECYLNAYDHEDPNFDYSGDFECRLSSLYTKEAYSTLLTEEKKQSRDWQSRGRFLIEELTGKCSEYPEYGLVRHFRLRGMELTLEIKNLKLKQGSATQNAPWNRERIKELDLEVTVADDPTATSGIATPTKYVEPPRAHPQDTKDLSRKCDKVITK
jgi:hypothetical protein